MRTTTMLALLFLSLTSTAQAQRTIAQDTLSMTTPVAVECGFCSMEAFGAVFREIGTAGGLRPADFPLTVLSVSLAMGAATVTGTPGACHGEATPPDPTTLVHVEIWAGVAPSGADAGPMSVDAMNISGQPPMGTAWTGEDLVFMQDMLPVTMSVPTTDGGSDYNFMLNTFNLGDTTTPAPTVAAGHTYLRVVVGLADGGSSSTCTPMTSAPTGFPLRDDPGSVVAPRREFIYAQGVGWMWNETAHIPGNWALRLSIEPLPHADAGPTDGGAGSDSGAARDGSAIDVGSVDAARASGGGGGGCGCRVGSRSHASIAALLVALALYSRKVTRPKRAGT
jgi:MYXO-CTERM domain-containing protein